MATASLNRAYPATFSEALGQIVVVRRLTSPVGSATGLRLRSRLKVLRDLRWYTNSVNETLQLVREPENARSLERANDAQLAVLVSRLATLEAGLSQVRSSVPPGGMLWALASSRTMHRLNRVIEQVSSLRAVLSRPKPSRVLLSTAEQAVFLKALDSPPEPNEALRQLFAVSR